MRPPTRELVHAWLQQLADGQITRREAADHAAPWIGEREHEVTDEALWRPLEQLAGADLEIAPSEYLHDVPDFAAWLDEYERSLGPEEPRPRT
jgi:hypothetical protein